MKPYQARYAIAWSDGGSLLVSLNSSKIMEPGFYLFKFDDEMREAVVGGPYKTAEERLQMPLRHLKESWPALDDALSRLTSHGCVCLACRKRIQSVLEAPTPPTSTGGE
jgi:hypothetical protein